MLKYKKNIKFWLELISSQIDKWKIAEDLCNEGAITDEEYDRLNILIWKIEEELERNSK